MDTKQEETLGQRLKEADAGYLDAVSRMDGSPEAETLLDWAKERYRAAEGEVVVMLGARGALQLVERSGLSPGRRASPDQP